MILVACLFLSFSLWHGCEQEPPPANPEATQEATQVQPFSKANRAVQAAIEAQNRHTDKLMENSDIIGTGIGMDTDGKAVIVVLTRKAGVPNIPSILDGYKTRTHVVGDVYAMAGYTKTYRPVPGGVSVGNANECAAGTIGCMVTIGGTRYMLSNNHVFARENAASIGERINQPGRYDAKPRCAQTGQVGTLSGFRSIVFSPSASNTIDAAIAAFSNGISSTCSMVSNLYTPSSTVTSPSVGLAVKKVGRTSGLTTGAISAINVTLNVGYSSGTARFVGQIMVNGSFIRSGDSGSLMVTQAGNNPVGLNFAGGSGGSFANPIGDVLSYFNATVCSQ